MTIATQSDNMLRAAVLQREEVPAETLQNDVLLAIVQRVAAARTSGEAAEAVFELLRDRCGLRAMTLETSSGMGSRFQPFGDSSALSPDLRPDSYDTAAPCYRSPLNEPFAPAGQITYAFAPGNPLPVSLLDAAAAQIAQKFALEMLAARAEEADDRANKRISEVATIYEIGQAVDQIALPRLFHMITNRAALLMDAQTCSLMRVNAQAGTLRVEASHGLPAEAMAQEQNMGEGIAGRVAQTEQPILIVYGTRDPRLEGVTLRPDIGSSMIVPMKSQDGRVLGVLSIRRRRPAPDFTDADLKLFSVFATQAALALTNIQLYEDARQHASELGKLSTLTRDLISTIDLEELLKNVADDICSLVGFTRCCLYIHDAARHAFVPRVWRGYPDSIGRNPVGEREGVIGAVGRDREALAFNARESPDPEQEKEKGYLQRKGFARSLGVDAFVAVPILTGQNECIGVAVADNRGRRDPISLEQARLLTAFINQAGIAIDNAQLYDKSQEDYQKIRRLNEYTENVLQSIPPGLLTTDGRGQIMRANRAAERILKQPPGSLRGASLTAVIGKMGLSESERDLLLERISHVQTTGESVHQYKVSPRPPSGTPMTLNLNLSRLVDHNQERAGVVLSLEDVTQEMQLGQQVERMRRLADIGQLAAKMAHEVRNALSPIKGAAQIIRQEMEGQGAGAEWPDIIIAEVDGLSRLTSAMLDFARPTPLDLRPLSISEFLVGAVMSLSSFLTEARVRVHWDVPSDLPEISADSIQLGQVVRNLVINAAQSMPEGGDLTVSAEYEPHAGGIVLRFQDTGVGIAAEEIERIFQPFVTTKPKGTGLGLPIVQKIVAHHGGKVEVESQVGAGTCFRVLLPLEPPRERSEVSSEEIPLISAQPAGPFPDN